MFANFIHFIIVLLIYTTYQPSEKTNFGPLATLLFFFALTGIFTCFTWVQFHRLKKQITRENLYRLDHKFNSILTRQTVTAILIFAINLYGLNLPAFFLKVPFFSILPTFQALLFLGLFVGYLAIIWGCAYGPYQTLYETDISRRTYIWSNISFSIPVLLPWVFLSGISDIINALPFDPPKHYLATTEGEIIYFLVFLFAVAIFGPALIQKFWRCKPLEKGNERLQIEHLCTKAGLKYANILYWPIFGGKMITAGVMGMIKKFRYILVTHALLHFLEPEEIDAVIAHEIGHIKKKHLLFYLFFFVGYMLLSYATFDLIIFSIIYTNPLYYLVAATGLDQTILVSAFFSVASIIIFFLYFRYIFGYFMRNFERQADTYVYTLFESGKALISTLEKIAATSGQRPDKPNWHHFSIKERIEYLKKCEKDKSWISRQDRKIKKSVTVYVVGMLLIGGIGFQLNFGDTESKLSIQFLEKTVLKALEKTPDNPNLYSILGDLYYSSEKYEGAIEAYRESISIDPNQARVLNNLAWLYATCENKTLRRPKQAIELAKQAAKLKQAPHILDTLAESYYINGQLNEAISAEMRALDLVGNEQRDYYENQLKKFRNQIK
ncbi:MAG: M48 family metalloprotease [Desulfobacterales bacterium]|nr:M48 family metalloprotease [Desulfobacterales bacterium]